MHSFFLSHLRGLQQDAFLSLFYKDLSETVIALLKVRPAPDTRVGFYDYQMPLGSEWDPALAEALQTSNVFIPLYSPAYFNSEFCGKEFALFLSRLAGMAAGPGSAAPPLVKPIVWTPFEAADVPKSVARFQYTVGSPDNPVFKLGLRRVIKQRNMYQSAYDDFVEALADDIVKLGESHGEKLPRVPDVPLSVVPNVFTATNGAQPSPKLSSPPRGPKLVKFVFVAAKPDEIAPLQGTADAQRLTGYIEQALPFRVRSGGALYFNAKLGSEEQVRSWLREVLTRLKAEIVSKADVQREMPQGGAKPIVNGPGAENAL